MIKKICISLLTVIGLGISYSFATEGRLVQTDNVVSSHYGSGFSMLVNSRGLFQTTFAGIGKNILAFNNGDYFLWLDGEKPYISSVTVPGNSSFNFQGVTDDFLLCSELTSGNLPQSCASMNYDNNKSIVFNIIRNIDKWFYGRFTVVNNSSPHTMGSLFCFSSSELASAVCFYSCGYGNCGDGRNDSIGGATLHSNLSNSQNFEGFTSIPDNRLGSYPGRSEGGVLDGSVDGSIDSTINGDYTYSSCTYKEIIDYAEYYGYSNYLCYAGSDDWSLYDPTQTYQFLPGTGVDLGSLYNYTKDGKSLFDWFKYWRGMYNGSTGNVDNALWQQQPVVLRLWFYGFITYGGDSLGGIEAVHEYCLMKKMVTGDALNGKYTGTKFKNTCTNIVQQKLDGTYLNDPSYSGSLSGSSVSVPISVNWGGVGNLSGGAVSDPLSFLQNFFNQLKSSMNTNGFGTSGEGFIPGYIIVALLGLIIFRFLRH